MSVSERSMMNSGATSNTIDLSEGRHVLQDVHDTGETLGLFRFAWDRYAVAPAVSDWEAIPIVFEVGPLMRDGEPNLLVVKVCSPWETEIAPGAVDCRAYTAVRNLIKGTCEHCDTLRRYRIT